MKLIKTILFGLGLTTLLMADMSLYNGNKDSGGLYVSSSNNKNQHFNIPIKSTVVTPPTNINNPGTAAKYFQIKSIEFSGSFGVFRGYTYQGHNFLDFPMGETNGIRLRVRDITIRWDKGAYGSKVSWSNGSFTGGNYRYSPGGFRMYSTNGLLRLQYKNGAYAQFKITKRAVNGKYVQHINAGLTFYNDANNRRFCFKVNNKNTGCVSYNIAYEAIP